MTDFVDNPTRWSSTYNIRPETQLHLAVLAQPGEVARAAMGHVWCYHHPVAPTYTEAKGWITYDEEAFILKPFEQVLVMGIVNVPIESPYFDAERGLWLAGVWCFKRRKLGFIQESEDLKRQTEVARAETQKATFELQGQTVERKLQLDLTTLAANAKTQSEQIARELEAEKCRAEITSLRLTQQVAEREVGIALDSKAQELKLRELTAQVQAVVEKGKAISPDLIAALSAFGERAMVEKVAEAMAPLSILTGGRKSVLEALGEMLKGTNLASQLDSVISKPNGAAHAPARGKSSAV